VSPPRRHRLLLALPAVGYAAVILLLSSRPGSDLPSTGLAGGDKLLHLAEYFLYGVLLLLPTRDLGGRGTALSVAVGVAYAAFDEWFQGTVPGRFGDLADFATDVAGLLLAVVVTAIAWRRPGRLAD